jgi:hypothetical protein
VIRAVLNNSMVLLSAGVYFWFGRVSQCKNII